MRASGDAGVIIPGCDLHGRKGTQVYCRQSITHLVGAGADVHSTIPKSQSQAVALSPTFHGTLA